MNTNIVKYALDPLERAGTTFVQQLAVLLLASGGSLLVTQKWAVAADTAAFAAIISLVTSVVTVKVSKLSDGLDLAWRVGKTFLQSMLGIMSADTFTHSVVHAAWGNAAGAALIVALTALLKGMAAMGMPQTSGASLLPNF